MITVWMVQPAVYEIIDMIAVWHLFMSTVWAVSMGAVDLRRAVRGILGIDRNNMFVHVVLMHMVQMTIVKIVHVTVMANRSVPTFRAMPMRVVRMMFLGAGGHRHAPC